MIKERNQCSSKGLSQSYLASKFAKWHVCINQKITELLKLVYMNHIPLICEICCGYQKSESHDQNDEISNSLNLSETICKEHVQKISDTFWPICKHFTWKLFIRQCKLNGYLTVDRKVMSKVLVGWQIIL